MVDRLVQIGRQCGIEVNLKKNRSNENWQIKLLKYLSRTNCKTPAVDIQKGIFRLVERLPKRKIIRLYKGLNISLAAIYQIIKDCEEVIPCVSLSKSEKVRTVTSSD